MRWRRSRWKVEAAQSGGARFSVHVRPLRVDALFGPTAPGIRPGVRSARSTCERWGLGGWRKVRPSLRIRPTLPAKTRAFGALRHRGRPRYASNAVFAPGEKKTACDSTGVPYMGHAKIGVPFASERSEKEARYGSAIGAVSSPGIVPFRLLHVLSRCGRAFQGSSSSSAASARLRPSPSPGRGGGGKQGEPPPYPQPAKRRASRVSTPE